MSRTIDSVAMGISQPSLARYTLRAYLIQGCEIPVFKKLMPDLEEGSLTARMKIRVSIGSNSIEWPLRINDKVGEGVSLHLFHDIKTYSFITC